MNHAKNFTFKNIISRILAFLIYFTASGFIGVFCHIIFNSIIRIAFRNNPEMQEIVLYLISLCATFGVLCFFSMREGFTDTQNLQYSILKTAVCYFISGIIFFIFIIFADIYIFGQEPFFKEYFLQYYYVDEYINHFTNNIRDFPKNNTSNGYFLSAAFILFNIGAMTLAYKAGRSHWIKRKKKRLQEMREKNI